MKFGDQVLEEPYKCDPSNQDLSCALHFDINAEDVDWTQADESTYTRSFVKNQCKCSLDGELDDNNQANGYCSSVIGTPIYAV